jgi:hypothetical protein
MKRRLIITSLALTGLFLAGCSGDSGDKDAVDQSTTTVDTRVVPPTLPPGEIIELGSVESAIQELDKGCADALQPIRDLQKKYQSGLELTDKDRPAFNDALSDGFGACSSDDWSRFQELELRGWMNAVPSDEAIQAAQQEALERQENGGSDADPSTPSSDDDPEPTTGG